MDTSGPQGLKGDTGDKGMRGAVDETGHAAVEPSIVYVEDIEVSDRRADLVRRVDFVLRILVVCVCVLFVCVGIQFFTQRTTSHNVDQLSEQVDTLQVSIAQVNADLLINRENGFKTRAKTCDMIITIGGTLDEFCLDQSVTKYYDPNRRPTVGDKSTTRSLICKLADADRIRPWPAECSEFPPTVP